MPNQLTITSLGLSFYNLDNGELSYVFSELNRLSDLDPLYRKCHNYTNVDLFTTK